MFEKHLNTNIFNCEEPEMNMPTQILVLIAIPLAVTFPETKAWVCLICHDCRVRVLIIQIRFNVQKWIKLKTFFNLPRFWNLKITNVVLVSVRAISIQNLDLTLCVVFWTEETKILVVSSTLTKFPIQFCSKLRQSLVNKLY